jgi:nitrogenase subunit NifH
VCWLFLNHVKLGGILLNNVLSEVEAHILTEFGQRQIQLKLAHMLLPKQVEQRAEEGTNKASLIVLHHI